MPGVYITCLQTNNPDYILRVERQGRTVFAVGDAILGGPNHTSGITKKLAKVGVDYVANISISTNVTVLALATSGVHSC